MTTAQAELPKGLIERRFALFITRQDKRLFDILVSGSALSARLTFAKLAALILAGLIHGIGVLVLFFAIYILQTRWAGSFSICWSVILLGVFWVSRPRFGKKPENSLSRSAHPMLFDVVNRVTTVLHSRPIDYICLFSDANAAIERAGIFQYRVLYIGYPLWAQLSSQERIALVAHEIAHDLNGDLTHGVLLSSARNTLISWHQLIAPSRNPNRVDTVFSLPFRLLLSILAQGILLIFFAFQQLTLYQSRRAEYLADTVAAQVGGTEATLSLLQKLVSYDYRSLSVLRRSHPPGQFRIELIQTQPMYSPKVTVSDEEMREVDRKLSYVAKNYH